MSKLLILTILFNILNISLVASMDILKISGRELREKINDKINSIEGTTTKVKKIEKYSFKEDEYNCQFHLYRPLSRVNQESTIFLSMVEDLSEAQLKLTQTLLNTSQQKHL